MPLCISAKQMPRQVSDNRVSRSTRHLILPPPTTPAAAPGTGGRTSPAASWSAKPAWPGGDALLRWRRKPVPRQPPQGGESWSASAGSGRRPAPVGGARDEFARARGGGSGLPSAVQTPAGAPDAGRADQAVEGAPDRVDTAAVGVPTKCGRDVPGAHVDVTDRREVLHDLFGEFAVLLVLVVGGSGRGGGPSGALPAGRRLVGDTGRGGGDG